MTPWGPLVIEKHIPRKGGEPASLLHFMVQVVTLTSTLADASEDRVTTMSLGDVINQLLDKHRLSDTGTSEETDLSTTGVWSEQVDD